MVLRIMLMQAGVGGGMSCNDCMTTRDGTQFKIPEDWGNFSGYSLEVVKSGTNVVAAGIHTVAFRTHEARTEIAAPFNGSPRCGEGAIERFRYDLIAQIAQVDSGQLGLRSPVDRHIIVKSDQQYQRDVMGIVEEQVLAFSTLVERLQSHRLLTPTEANERRLHIDLRVVPMELFTAAPHLPDFTLLRVVLTLPQE